MRQIRPIVLCCLSILYSCDHPQPGQDTNGNVSYPHSMFEYTDNIEPRWSSFENINGKKGKGGMENHGAKGHPFDIIKAGETKTLLDTQGPGIINRMWVTIRNRSPHTLRGLIINMYWDDAEKPAVSVPFGDFFGIGLGKTAVYENALFANPEGRSFNSYVQMPFAKAAKIEIVNPMDYDIFLVFFDVNYQLLHQWDDNFLYFHAYWHRDTATILGQDFRIMPKVAGKGRFLGMNVSVQANPEYKEYWWGEGEVKMYLDGDDAYPTLVGTGTEDYIGTAWGQGQFSTRYNGCLIADPKNKQWAFYRYHIVDPIYFSSDCQVTIQQMGGTIKRNVIALQNDGVDLIPITINGEEEKLLPLYQKDSVVDLGNPALPGGDAWTNFFRSDDVSAVAYFYLDSPTDSLPAIQDLAIRSWNLTE